MATPPNIYKHRTDNIQLGCSLPEEVEAADALGNMDANANCGAEPNFNLNFNLTSPSNPRSTTEVRAANRKEDRSKGGGKLGVNRAVTPETKRPVMSPGEEPRSTVQVSSDSPRTQTTRHSRAEQRLKSPNIRQPPTLSHETQTRDGIPSSPKPNAVTQMSGPGTTGVQRETPEVKPAKPQAALTNDLKTRPTNKMTISPNTQSSKKESGEKINLPTSPRVHNQKGDPAPIHPQQETDPEHSAATSDQRPERNTRTQGSETSCTGPTSSPTQNRESLLVSPATNQMVSRSPKPSMKGKAAHIRNSNTSGSKKYLHGKDSRAGPGSKTTKSSSSSKVSRVSKDLLDSKGRTNSKSQTGSKDTLNSKSSSASKSSLDSKNSLDSKTGPNSTSKMGSRYSLDFKTRRETKAKKVHQDSEAITDSTTSTGSNNEQAPRPSNVSPNPKTSLCVTEGSAVSDPIPSYKTGVTKSTSRPSLQAPGFSRNIPGSVSLSPLTRGRLQTTGSTAKPSLLPKPTSDSSRSGPVRSSSKSALVDLSSPLVSAANQSPGSSSVQRLGSGSAGSNKKNQRSPSSSREPLASFSPQTKTTATSTRLTAGSPKGPTSSFTISASVQRTGLTRGLTFDSITKTTAKTEKEHLQANESKVGAAGALEGSTGTNTDNDGRSLGDNGRRSGALLGKLDQLGNANVFLSSRPTSAKEETRKKMGGNQSLVNSSSAPCPLLSHSSPTATSKLVKESWTMTELFERLHLQPAEQKDVGVQVEVEVVEHSASTSTSLQWEAPICSLIGSPSCQSTLSDVPSLKHNCKIDIELNSQTQRPSTKTRSLPICLSTASFKPSPALILEVDHLDVDEEELYKEQEHHGGPGKTVKPQEVVWDEQGMTWEVYGASVDLESLGKAIQSHLESKIREQQKHIRTLRKSICSNSSLRRYKTKKRTGRFLGCCVKTPPIVD